MPKLDGTHLVERLQRRIAELEAGKELAARDVAALLTPEQSQQLTDAWAAQQRLRQLKPARTKSEQQKLGWRSKKEVRLDVLKNALSEAKGNEVPAWKAKVANVDVRQGRTYFEAYGKARDAGKSIEAARTFANNELTRAGLRRLDGIGVRRLSKRDQEIRDLEEFLLREDADDADVQSDNAVKGTKRGSKAKPPSS